MSYEETIRAKHEFEDSFKEMLQILSVMDHRELELAAAKLGDGVRGDDRLDTNSALLTAKIIHMILNLRAGNELSQSKLMRVWMRRKKKTFARQIAVNQLFPERDKYEKELAKIKRMRKKQLEEHRFKVTEYHNKLRALPFWKQIFDRPPHPGPPILSRLPTAPSHPSDLTEQIAGTKEFGEILIYAAYYYTYPNIEYADNYVQEDNVKKMATLLLEDKK